MAQLVENPPAMWETWVRSLGWEDPLEKGKAAVFAMDPRNGYMEPHYRKSSPVCGTCCRSHGRLCVCACALKELLVLYYFMQMFNLLSTS